MAREQDDLPWGLPRHSPVRANPFRIGGIGLLLLFAGFALKTHVASLMEEADRERVLARLQQATQSGKTDPTAAAAVDRASRYYRGRLHWEMAGQLVFFVGLGFVIAAGVIWYRQAQLPEPDEEPADEPQAS